MLRLSPRLGGAAARQRGVLLASRQLCGVWSRPLSTQGSSESAAPAAAPAASIADRARKFIYGDDVRKRASEKVLELRESGKGWIESSTDAIASMRKERKNEAFAEHLATLLNHKQVSFGIIREQIEQIANARDSMTAMQRMQLQFDNMRGGAQSEALEGMIREYKLQLRVIDAMTPSEREKPLMLIKREAIRRIVEQLGLPDDKPVKAVLRMYRGIQVQHELVHREAKAGRPIPSSQDEVDRILKLYPTRASIAYMKAEHWKEVKRQQRKNQS